MRGHGGHGGGHGGGMHHHRPPRRRHMGCCVYVIGMALLLGTLVGVLLAII